VSSPRRLGLPETLRMRHDAHYVDQLGRPGGAPIGRLIPIEDLEPNPGQPRQEIGDLTELVASIRENGILEPVLVRPSGGRFQIIAGERRYRAAVEIGLADVPCVVREATDAEVMELALVENLQRKDLNAYEEADGLKALAETFGYTHEKMAKKLGKSRTSITETLAIAAIPANVRDLCRRADIHSKSLLLQVVRQNDSAKMADFVGRLKSEGAGTRDEARRILHEAKKPSRGRPKNYAYRFQAPGKSFTLNLQFRKSEVERDEVIKALLAVIEELRGK
jgi:ParB family transcriptional regulator, chromosome partitioning protein